MTTHDWSIIPADMIEDLRQPLRLRCVWCKRLVSAEQDHHPACKEQLDEWARMPWGKYKNQRIADIDTGYLELCLRWCFGDRLLRQMILNELIPRDRERYAHPQWQRFVDRSSADD